MCRLCNQHEESILRLFQCPSTAPLWKAGYQFCVDAMGASPRPHNIRNAVIFNIRTPAELLPIPICAFLRHLYGAFYHDFANVDLKNGKFVWQNILRDAVRSFQNAVLRWGMHHRHLYVSRRYTNLPPVAPHKDRDKFAELIQIGEEGDFMLQPSFLNAVAAVEKQAADHNHHTNNQ